MKRRIAPLMLVAMLFLLACNMTIMLQMPIPFLEDGNATPTQEIVALPTATPSGYIGYIAPKSVNVNVRGGPGMTYPIVQTLFVGKSLPVLMQNAQGWYQVEITAQGQALALAWVSGNVVKFSLSDPTAS
jgi:SH3-like domain-containing protein